MSLLLNPAFADLLNSQLNNVGYGLRGWMRVKGESVGLPKAVPDDRKMDYWFRDFFMVFVTGYITELSYRLGEQLYTVPNFIRLLGLNSLKKTYSSPGIHKPAFLSGDNLAQLRDARFEFPHLLRNRMLGSLVQTRSYSSIPDILERMVIPELKRKKAPPGEILQAQLWAHHLRRRINPEQYIDKFLTVGGKITPEEARLLKEQLKRGDDLVGLFEKAKAPISAKELYERLKESGRLRLLGHSLTERDLERAMKRSSLFDLLGDLRRLGFREGVCHFRRIKALARNPWLQRFRKEPSPALKELAATIKRLASEPAFQDSPFFRQFLGDGSIEQALAKRLKPPSSSELLRICRCQGFRKAWAFYRENSRLSRPDELMALLRQEILLPLSRHRFTAKPALKELFHELSNSKVIQKQLHKVFEGGRFWLKLPLSLLSLFLFFGLIANAFDAKYLQPYQREITKQRGNSNEFLLPGFLGAAPGAALFALLMKTPWVQRLGYVPSFALAGLAGLGTWAVSSFGLFRQRIATPRQQKPFTQQATPPAGARAQAYPSSQTRSFPPVQPIQVARNHFPQPHGRNVFIT